MKERNDGMDGLAKNSVLFAGKGGERIGDGWVNR